MKIWLYLFAIVLIAFVLSTDCAKISKRDSHSGSSDWSTEDWEEYGRKELAIARRKERQRQQVLKLYTNILYPTSSYIAYEIEHNNYTVVEDLMIYNVTGRINPLGRFDTFFSTGEYFYSLAGPLPGVSTTGRSRVTDLWWTLPITCENNSCWYRADIGMRRFSDNVIGQNYTHIGVMNFDASDRICSYEADFIGIDRALNVPENAVARQTAYSRLCAGIMAGCTGANQQYNGDVTQCIAFMNSIPYGGWGQADQNTVACRQLHIALVNGNPSVHCPHVGPTGGGKCVFHAASTYFQDNLDGCRDKNLLNGL